jgi:hypothetical protein
MSQVLDQKAFDREEREGSRKDREGNHDTAVASFSPLSPQFAIASSGNFCWTPLTQPFNLGGQLRGRNQRHFCAWCGSPHAESPGMQKLVAKNCYRLSRLNRSHKDENASGMSVFAQRSANLNKFWGHTAKFSPAEAFARDVFPCYVSVHRRDAFCPRSAMPR